MDDLAKLEWGEALLNRVSRCPQHQFFTLTKQPQNLFTFMDEVGIFNYGVLSNLWNGVSISDEDDLWRIDELMKVRGKKWLSIEPLLDWTYLLNISGISFIVIGCESGPKRRPCPISWINYIVDRVRGTDTKLWIKQLDIDGKVVHDIDRFPKHLQIRERPE